MTDNKFEIKLRGRLLKIEDNGLTPLELGAVVNQVEKRLIEMEEKTQLVDGSKLAMLVAIELAAELFKLKKLAGNLNHV